MKFEQWNGFLGKEWQSEVNVRQFIQDNYTPYEGDSSFLEGPTARTNELMGKFNELLAKEAANGGVLDVDTVVMSIGTSPNPLIKDTTTGLEINRWGGIIVDESTGKTSLDGVYAGGDAVTGAATVILAMGAGKTAADAIDEYIQNK